MRALIGSTLISSPSRSPRWRSPPARRANEIPVSSLGEDDDAICRANNVVVGSSEYVACRKNRDVQRGNAAAKADRAQKNLSETMVNTPYKP